MAENQNANNEAINNNMPIVAENMDANHNVDQNNVSQNPAAVQNPEVGQIPSFVHTMQQQILQQQQMMQEQMRMMQETHAKLMDTTLENNRLRHQLSETSKSETKESTQRPKRPDIDEETSEGDWEIFVDAWDRYKSRCKLEDIDSIRYELRQTCSTAINKRLIELHGAEDLKSVSEVELLNRIKDAAVSAKHPLVHRLEFHQITQKDNESMTQYMARIKAKADLCQFKSTCSCDIVVSYKDDMVATQAINGLTNPQFQTRIIEEAERCNSLKELHERLMAFEATNRSSGILQNARTPSSSANAASSEHQRKKKQEQRKKFKPKNASSQQDSSAKKPCSGCGETSHAGKEELKRADCPAQGKECSKCGKPNHFAKACRGAGRSNANAADVENNDQEYLNAAMFALACSREDEDFRLCPNQSVEK